MKTNINYHNKVKTRQHGLMSFLKNMLFIVIFATVTLTIQANNTYKSDSSEIDSCEPTKEPEMKLKAWMLDADLFKDFVMNGYKGLDTFVLVGNVVEEEELQLEAWMLDKELFVQQLENAKFADKPVVDWNKSE